MKLEPIDLHNLNKETLISIITQQQALLNSLGTKLVQDEERKAEAEVLKHRIKKQFGNQTGLAKYLGVSQARVSKWVQGEKIPDVHNNRIKKVSHGHINFNGGNNVNI